LVKLLDIDGHPVIRIPLHGWRFPETTLDHTLATFWLLQQLGSEQVIVDASVGGVLADPWDVVIPDDVINNDPAKISVSRLAYSLNRDPWVRMYQPFCSRLGDSLASAYQKLITEGTEEPQHPLGRLIKGGVYYTMPLGPFESVAEIKLLRGMGATIVGQSSGQEALAARICGMCLGVINPVANFAEGINNGAWTPGGMDKLYEELAIPMALIVYWTLQEIVNKPRDCQCSTISKSADITELTN